MVRASYFLSSHLTFLSLNGSSLDFFSREVILTVLSYIVTDQASIKAAVSQISTDFGRLDVLINNAGIIVRNPNFLENLRTVFETNTFGPAVVTEAFLPLLEKSRDGRLVYVSSGLGSMTMRSDPSAPYYQLPGTTYRMSKAALNSTSPFLASPVPFPVIF